MQPLDHPVALGGPQQASDGHNRDQDDGNKEDDGAHPGAVLQALPEAAVVGWDHVGQVQHVAQGPADGCVPGLRGQGRAFQDSRGAPDSPLTLPLSCTQPCKVSSPRF